MNLNKDILKSCLIRDKGFLKQLYQEPNVVQNKKVLQTADDTELNTLIKYLHFLSNGEIPTKKSNFEAIKESKKQVLITKKVEKKSNVVKLLKSSRVDKLKFLFQLVKIYQNLLYPLFNEQ
jgi:hypothetical protein